MSDERQFVRSGSNFEALAGYSRALRVGNRILVSGTAATGPDGRALEPDDAYAQTQDCIARALGAISELGGSVGDVVRTRLLMVPDADWMAVVRAHGEYFAGVFPANTTVYVAGFVPEGVLVEVEMEAMLSE